MGWPACYLRFPALLFMAARLPSPGESERGVQCQRRSFRRRETLTLLWRALSNLLFPLHVCESLCLARVHEVGLFLARLCIHVLEDVEPVHNRAQIERGWVVAQHRGAHETLAKVLCPRPKRLLPRWRWRCGGKDLGLGLGERPQDLARRPHRLCWLLVTVGSERRCNHHERLSFFRGGIGHVHARSPRRRDADSAFGLGAHMKRSRQPPCAALSRACGCPC